MQHCFTLVFIAIKEHPSFDHCKISV